jgi:hypothetical protein
MIATEIFTGKTPAEEFREELVEQMKAAALELGCDVEELKYRIDNVGIVEIARMEPDEISQMETDRVRKKQMKAIRKMRGVN